MKVKVKMVFDVDLWGAGKFRLRQVIFDGMKAAFIAFEDSIHTDITHGTLNVREESVKELPS